jgi:endonuclease/exonuclease/phosphatase (EEP) superfamily protein YafD
LIFVEIFALVIVFATLWSLIPRDEWWFRGLDFPRLQIIFLGFIAWFALLVFPAEWDVWRAVCIFSLAAALAYQMKMVLPYTFLWPKQVQQVEHQKPAQQISILVSNVLTPNRQHYLLLEQIRQLQPDIVLTLESDRVWEQALSGIEPDYPYIVRVPQDNLYGMHLYSRLKLSETEVKFLLTDEIPSIHTTVTLRSGQPVKLYCLHPKPPSPTEAKESTLRDAELLMIGDYLEAQDQTCIVMGDLNDVAWSRTTRLFQRISGLLDPRVGRKFINTFHVSYPFLRWSLDHVFHSRDFALIDMHRLPNMGSDHFPVFTVLQCDKEYVAEQPALEADAADEEEAQEKIEKGILKAQTE